MRLGVLALLVGCGRLGFEARDDGAIASGDVQLDDAGNPIIDADPDAPPMGSMVIRFGEAPTADVMGVTTDTYVSQQDAGDNFGASDNLRIERDQGARGLLRFDLSSVPTTAVITLARLHLGIEVATPSTISIHRVQEAWTEGNLDGAPGAANFTFRSGIVIWSILGAGQPASVTAEVANFSGSTMGGIDIALPTAMVQAWIADPAMNFGILFASNSDETVRLISSEGDPTTERPVLAVTIQ